MGQLQKIAPFFGLVFLFFFILDAHLDYPEKTPRAVVLKTLPILWLAFLVFRARHSHVDFTSYQTSILLGLLVSLIGDAFLVWMEEMFIPGLVFFLIAHLFYIKGFGLRPLGAEAGFLLGISAIVMFMFMLPGIKENEMRIFAFSYSAVIVVMFWRSLVRWQQRPDVGNLAGSLGALLFMASDFIIGLDKWRMSVPYANALIMITYYLAQFGIANSVLLYGISGYAFLGRSDRKEKKG